MGLLVARPEKYYILGFRDLIDKETRAVVELTKVAPRSLLVFEEWRKFSVPLCHCEWNS
jgi:hypothetical protein